ncbi:SDR family oxidoreductase [Leifsonia poae]|uniref:Short-chain dehydrogenase n=1 Tax=Leifsonia poae TaxID=110933 RepID=A0A9W6HB97_9MICO|nr:SDR family oxidoreductase [Leifsonia poae]GLJ77361.1 short-chain dehydrogenase [Leifsonia poae]
MSNPETVGSEATETRKVVWITGAGSGMGRAAAIEAAKAGWRVALTGRRSAALEETAAAVRTLPGHPEALIVTADVTDDSDIESARDRILERWGRIDGLVLAAGLNSPRRRWSDQDLPAFDDIVSVNLVAPAHVVAAALPALREARGVVVFVSSYAAWAFNPIAGVAYSASKSGLSALSRTLNAQEAESGVRACHLCPGDVNTDFLELRPQVPDDAARAAMLQPDEVARAIQFVLDAPGHVRYDELVISPTSQR